MIYWKLFLAFVQIGLYSFGGGYATLPHIQSIIVKGYGWIDMAEYVDIITISQMTPGPIAINAATFVGTKVAGVWGGAIATIGSVTPSVIISLSMAWIYYKYKNMAVIKGLLSGLRPAVVAFITIAGIGIVQTAFVLDKTKQWNAVGIGLFIVCFILIQTKRKLDPIYIMVGAGFANVVIQYFMQML